MLCSVVSLKDIAAHCGVSVATVSKALNEHQDISQETRDRIRQAADQMGYMANAAARTLKTNRSYNIGVLFVDQRSSGLAHEFFSSVLDSVRVEAERSGIASVDFKDPLVAELVASGLPVVTVDHVFNNRIAVISDNIQGMQQLTQYVIDRGHRKLAYIHGEVTTVTENRLIGFHRACARAGITVPENWMRLSEFHDSDNCYLVTRELLSAPERPTCIFFPDDYSFIGAMNAIRELGLRVPEDISAVGYDGIPLSQMISPRLTTWKQNTKELGRLAAASLIELIEHPKTAILDRHIVSGSLLEGESVLDLSKG